MRILAIRGQNLASLASAFEVDFRVEPLASAGLFAICGPTGAGKSTLLDALCLALYDETPRLSKATVAGVSLPDVGEETVTPKDSRTLLRRGTAEGYAEVDFVGNDAVAYRARWSVRRARGRTEGKLQAAEMSLARLADGQPIGGARKGEVLAAIEARLGLSFAQFNRAVLLAQNEFSAFLKANDNERAELLETLTGTDTYTDISKRAFERAKAEQETWKRLEAQHGEQKPLDAEARADLERALAAARQVAAQLEARKVELDAHLRWYEAWARHQQACRQAQEALDRARAEGEAAATRRERLACIESVQAARSALAERDRTAQEVEQSRTASAAVERQLAAAEQAYRTAEAAHLEARQRVTAAEQARSGAAADLDRAKALDAQIEALAPQHLEADETLRAARTAATDALRALEAKQSEQDSAQRDLTAASDWLARNAQLKPLAEGWTRWDELLAQASHLQAEHYTASRKAQMARKAHTERERAVRAAAAQLTITERSLGEAQARHDAALQALTPFDADAIAARRSRAETRRELLQSAEQHWHELAARLGRQAELDGAALGQQDAMRQAESALADALARKPTVIGALEQAERTLRILAVACTENVERLREGLEADTPCPVCGAREHPYATEHPALRAALQELEAEVNRCRQALRTLEQQEAAHRTLADNAHAQLAGIERERTALARSIEAETAAWNAHPIAAALAEVAADARLEWFEREQQSVSAALDTIRMEEAAWRGASKAKDAAQAQLDAARQSHSAAQQAEAAARLALEQAHQAAAAAGERCAEIEARLAAILQTLDDAFSEVSWRAVWQADPDHFHQRQKTRAAQWLAQQRAVDGLQGRLGTLEVELNGLAQAAAKAVEQRDRATESVVRIAHALEAKHAQRRGFFEGCPIGEVEATLAQAIEEATATANQRAEIVHTAATEHARALEALEQAGQLAQARQQAAALAEQALAAWLTAYNTRHTAGPVLDSVVLRALLAHDGAWIGREREALQALDAATARAATVLQERETQRGEHARIRPTADPVETVQAAQADLATELHTTKGQLTELEWKQRQDEERRERSTALLQAIEQQAATARLWAQLNELIGAADGKKFRNYAQQLTLDVLLGYANRHLAALTRRYRLERVRDTLALLVVDQDMADEVRSVHSLSGGESFLVSLALALALASLSSNRVRVESLFIDEGFGSLDADTLRVAMDALDALQAQGRKVGVISHVQEMTERIGTQIQVQRLAGGQSRIVVALA